MVVCDSCNQQKSFDRDDKCQCGGTFYDIDDMEWIEKEESDCDFNVTTNISNENG